MRIHLLIFFLTAPLLIAQDNRHGKLLIEGIPGFPNGLIERSNQYLNTRSAAFLDWKEDGGMYIATRFGGTVQTHSVSGPGAARVQLTFFDEPVTSAAADPRPGRSGFLFSKDSAGNEFYQVYHFDNRKGAWTLLTDGSSRHEGMNWSRSGHVFACSSTRRNGRDTDVWLIDPESSSGSRPLTRFEGSWHSGDWSPDDRALIVYRYVSASDIRPFIADVATGVLRPINSDSTRRSAYGGFAWSGDGRTLFYASDEGGDFRHLYAYDPATGASRDLTPELKWDVGGITVSREGGLLAFTTNEDGCSALNLRSLPEMKVLPVPGTGIGVISGLKFDADGKRLAMTINTPTGPGDVYVLDIRTNELRRWTFSETGGLDAASFVTPKLIRYPSFDMVDGKRREIPAFLYEPRRAAGKAPVIINIHGGPEGQSRPVFNPAFQYWINELGCAVLDPNVRGSTGYGKAWQELDNGMLRENSVRDIGALMDWIALRPNLDAQRVAVIGGSYGGYMVLASLTNYSARIRCGVDVVGISDFVTFLENTESYRRDLRRAEYGDERDGKTRGFLERISPLRNAAKIRSPLFVAHGENDPRVPASEARQIADAARKNGISVWTMFAADEGHGFQKKANRDFYTRAVILFFETFLLK